MPAEEIKDAIEPFEKLYEPELDKLEIEEEYARDIQEQRDRLYEYDIDCGS